MQEIVKSNEIIFWILFSSILYLQTNASRDCIRLLRVKERKREREKMPYAMQTIQFTVQCYVVFYVHMCKCANIPFKWTKRLMRELRKQHTESQREREGVQVRYRKEEQTNKSEHYKRLARFSANWYSRICVWNG